MKCLILVLLAGFLFCGCAHSKKSQPASHQPTSSANVEIRNNAASLLYSLFGDEKNVSKLLIVKRNSEDLGHFIKTISNMAADGEKQLDQMAKNDSGLNLKVTALPQGEKATRDAISKTKAKELLSSSGPEFEFKLLMTQVEALSYGSHLAKIAAENSSRPEQIQKFTMMSQTMEKLHRDVIARMVTIKIPEPKRR